MHIETESDGLSYFERRYRTGHKLWKMPLIRGRWVNFVRHVKFSKDANVGYEELWVDGVKQTFAPMSGTPSEVRVSSDPTRLLLPTVLPDQTEPSNWSWQNYRRFGSFPNLTVLYQDNARVGTSYGSVDPAQ
jgi:Polysaccharide lyase